MSYGDSFYAQIRPQIESKIYLYIVTIRIDSHRKAFLTDSYFCTSGRIIFTDVRGIWIKSSLVLYKECASIRAHIYPKAFLYGI